MGGDYTEESNDEDQMKYKMAFQKPNVIRSSGNNAAPAPPATAAAPTSSAAPASSTFLAVQ